jgi:hypothetical protein
MSLNFYSIDNLVFALKLFVLSVLICAIYTLTLIQILLFLWEVWELEFKVTPVELKIYQLID